MSNRLLYSLAFLLTISFNVSGQSSGRFTADSILIYKDFKRAGTTAGLKYNHRYLDSINAPKVKLNTTDLAEFIDIFKSTTRKKLIQQKYGGEICYLLVYNKGIKNRLILYTSLDAGLLHNLDAMKLWRLNKPEDKKRFYDLIRKYW